MRFVQQYNRLAAVRYAHKWAYGRNPAFYDYEEIGGDCTNYASQCLFAGTGVMNYTKDFGWYYIDSDEKAPAWTGVEYLHQFLTRDPVTQGPVGEEVDVNDVRPGDILQLSFNAERYQHTPVVVVAGRNPTPQTIWVAAHSYDADYRPLSTYEYQKLRCLHITGVVVP